MESQLGSPVALSLSCKRVRRSQLQTFDIDKCEICQKDKVKKGYCKGARTREQITLNISEFGSATLIKAARIWNDSCILLHIDGRDTIAMKIKYHRSCYKNYVPPEQLTKLEEQNCQELVKSKNLLKKKSSLRQKPFRCQPLLKNTLPSLQKKE